MNDKVAAQDRLNPVSLVVPIARKTIARTTRNAQIAIVRHLPDTSAAMLMSFRQSFPKRAQASSSLTVAIFHSL